MKFKKLRCSNIIIMSLYLGCWNNKQNILFNHCRCYSTAISWQVNTHRTLNLAVVTNISTLTGNIMPLVHSKQPASSHCNNGWYSQAWLSVGSNMGDRGVRWELKYHDDILLHLVCEHQRSLQEEILFSGKIPNQIQIKIEKVTGDEEEEEGKNDKEEEID